MKIDMFVLLGIEEDLQFQKWNKRKINSILSCLLLMITRTKVTKSAITSF
jgi:hypothetical protein